MIGEVLKVAFLREDYDENSLVGQGKIDHKVL